MAKKIYRTTFEDIIHVSVKGLADWTSGSLKKHAPKWQQCCCLDCSDSEHGDGRYSCTAKPMDKPFYGGVYKGIRYVSVEGADHWTAGSPAKHEPKAVTRLSWTAGTSGMSTNKKLVSMAPMEK